MSQAYPSHEMIDPQYLLESIGEFMFRCFLGVCSGMELYLLRVATDEYHAERTNASKFALLLLAGVLLKFVCVVLPMFLYIYFAVYERTPANQRTRYTFCRSMDIICGGLSLVLFLPFFIATATGYGAKVPKGHNYDHQLVFYDMSAYFFCLPVLIFDDFFHLSYLPAPSKQEGDDVELQSIGTTLLDEETTTEEKQ